VPIRRKQANLKIVIDFIPYLLFGARDVRRLSIP